MTIDNFFQKSDVFQDANVFNEGYIPDIFLYRDDEIKTVGTEFAYLYNGTSGQHLWINGPPSTGKTQVVKRLVQEFNAHANNENRKVFFAYTNAREKTLPPVYAELLSKFNPELALQRGISTTEIIHKIKKIAKSRYKYVNFIFDEIDKIVPTPSHKNPINEIIGTFTRLHEDGDFELSDIGYMTTIISNDMHLHKHLSQSTQSTFVAHNVKFNEYDARQFGTIFQERCKLGFLPNIVKDEDVLHFSASLCKGVKDVRTGLRVLHRAGQLVDRRDGVKKISWDDIQRAFKLVEKDKLFETIIKLDEPQLAFLVSVARAQQRKEVATTSLVYRIYTQIAHQHCFEVLKPRYMMEFIAPKLDGTGLITTAVKGLGRGKGISKTFEVLDEELKDILDMGESELEKRSEH